MGFENKSGHKKSALESSFSLEEGSVSEKTSFVENLNRLVGHINHIASYPTLGSYVESVLQLDAMLESYKDEKYKKDTDELTEKIKDKTKSFDNADKTQWLEDNASMIHRELFKILMKLMSRSGLSPTGRISSIDIGNVA